MTDTVVSLSDLTADHFLPHADSQFRLHLENGEVTPLTLTSVVSHSGISGAGRSPFSLHFLGSPEVVLPQRIYRIDHDAIGTLEIFIVPTGNSPTGTAYEAVFS